MSSLSTDLLRSNKSYSTYLNSCSCKLYMYSSRMYSNLCSIWKTRTTYTRWSLIWIFNKEKNFGDLIEFLFFSATKTLNQKASNTFFFIHFKTILHVCFCFCYKGWFVSTRASEAHNCVFFNYMCYNSPHSREFYSTCTFIINDINMMRCNMFKPCGI